MQVIVSEHWWLSHQAAVPVKIVQWQVTFHSSSSSVLCLIGYKLVNRKLFPCTQYSGIWAKPNSENFSQCIDHTKKKSKLNFFLFISWPNILMNVCFVHFHFSVILFSHQWVIKSCNCFAEMDAKINGYILINANGGLNQMRFGVWLHLYQFNWTCERPCSQTYVFVF